MLMYSIMFCYIYKHGIQFFGGFQKQIGCVMTYFTLKETVLFSNEMNSKCYVCFLDARQAFDRVWHNGIMFTLLSVGVEPAILKTFFNLYRNMKSCVHHLQYRSSWFEVKQGTRQGGKNSPLLYLMYINGLIKELE